MRVCVDLSPPAALATIVHSESPFMFFPLDTFQPLAGLTDPTPSILPVDAPAVRAQWFPRSAL